MAETAASSHTQTHKRNNIFILIICLFMLKEHSTKHKQLRYHNKMENEQHIMTTLNVVWKAITICNDYRAK